MANSQENNASCPKRAFCPPKHGHPHGRSDHCKRLRDVSHFTLCCTIFVHCDHQTRDLPRAPWGDKKQARKSLVRGFLVRLARDQKTHPFCLCQGHLACDLLALGQTWDILHSCYGRLYVCLRAVKSTFLVSPYGAPHPKDELPRTQSEDAVSSSIERRFLHDIIIQKSRHNRYSR